MAAPTSSANASEAARKASAAVGALELVEVARDGPHADRHADAVVAVADRRVEFAQVVLLPLDPLRDPSEHAHDAASVISAMAVPPICTNIGQSAGAASRSCSSSSSCIRVIDAPAISSDVTYSPT
jgi:hypothetical protein